VTDPDVPHEKVFDDRDEWLVAVECSQQDHHSLALKIQLLADNTDLCLGCHLARGPAEAGPAASLAQLFEFLWRFIRFRTQLTPSHIARLQISHLTNSFEAGSTRIAS
jgi:predicted CXXCH cytochrome family protein